MQELADTKSAAARKVQQAQESALARCSGFEAKLQVAQQECAKVEQGHRQTLAQLQVRPPSWHPWTNPGFEAACFAH